MSSVLGVTVEKRPAAPLVTDVQFQVTRLAPSPPPPSPPPTPPPSSPTTAEVLTLGLWALLPLSVLFIAAVVLFVLCYRRRGGLHAWAPASAPCLPQAPTTTAMPGRVHPPLPATPTPPPAY
eukprot:scaffold15840_cov42-Phaeocystis_antarctica.AAC.2